MGHSVQNQNNPDFPQKCPIFFWLKFPLFFLSNQCEFVILLGVKVFRLASLKKSHFKKYEYHTPFFDMKSFVWSMRPTKHNDQCLSSTENVDISIRKLEIIRFYTLYIYFFELVLYYFSLLFELCQRLLKFSAPTLQFRGQYFKVIVYNCQIKIC